MVSPTRSTTGSTSEPPPQSVLTPIGQPPKTLILPLTCVLLHSFQNVGASLGCRRFSHPAPAVVVACRPHFQDAACFCVPPRSRRQVMSILHLPRALSPHAGLKDCRLTFSAAAFQNTAKAKSTSENGLSVTRSNFSVVCRVELLLMGDIMQVTEPTIADTARARTVEYQEVCICPEVSLVFTSHSLSLCHQMFYWNILIFSLIESLLAPFY